MTADTLSRYPVLSTQSVDEAEARLGSTLADCRIMSAAAPRAFQLQMNAARVGRTSVVFNRYATECVVETPLDPSFLYCNVGSEAPTTQTMQEKRYLASSTQWALVHPGEPLTIHRPAGSELLVLRVSLEAIQRQLEAITDRHHQGTIVFEGQASTREGPGSALRRAATYVIQELDAKPPTEADAALDRAYEELLLTSLLALPHSKSHTLRPERHHEIAPGFVRRAEAWMHAHLGEPITISDLLRVCGCSRTTLFGAFRTSRGCTPMEFLTEQRLLKARDALRRREPGDTVARIAQSCGFTHLGRFSGTYARRFGERPSETLRG